MNEANIVLLNAGSPGILNQERQLATVFEKTAMAILVFDSAAYLSYANPAGRDLFDDYESNVGHKLPADSGYESLHQLLEKARLSQVSLTGDVVWPDQRVFSTEIIPAQEDSYAVTLYDVSRFKDIEKIKNEFIAAASHDLRTPLTSITGFSHLIKKSGPLTESQSEFVQRIEHATANMSELVDNMLNLGKLELRAEPRKDEVNLLRMLWDVAGEFQPQAEVKRHLLMIGIIEPDTKVFGDAWQLRQALRNLVENAIKYTPDGGAITLLLEHESNMAKIQIKDTGYGIPSPDLPHIFDRFYRARGNGHDQIEGSGLGLAIVKSIIEQHQGQIDVQSEPCKGTCFTVKLPLALSEVIFQKQ